MYSTFWKERWNKIVLNIVYFSNVIVARNKKIYFRRIKKILLIYITCPVLFPSRKVLSERNWGQQGCRERWKVKWGRRKRSGVDNNGFFLATPTAAEVPRPGIKPTPQQWPKPLQRQCWSLSPLCHKRTPKLKQEY